MTVSLFAVMFNSHISNDVNTELVNTESLFLGEVQGQSSSEPLGHNIFANPSIHNLVLYGFINVKFTTNTTMTHA